MHQDVGKSEPAVGVRTGARSTDVGAGPGLSAALRLPLFVATSFVSAFLLFLIQPMFTKMVLPVLGGSPSVWAVALVFFQTALLAGYAYAHLLTRALGRSAGGAVHVALLLAAALFLPIAVPADWREPPLDSPYLWQLGLYAVAIGLPFLAVAAHAPLLQAWFAQAGHARSADPYFLYAASNLGSFLALIGYPFLLEPIAGVSVISLGWSVGFGVLVVLVVGCLVLVRGGVAVAGSGPAEVRAASSATATGSIAEAAAADGGPATFAPPTLMRRLGWIGLAFVPAGLLTAFSTHLSTDVASAPLLWVLPLAVYLLTYVIVFRDPPLLPRSILGAFHVIAVGLALLQLSQSEHNSWFISSGIGFAAFAATALMAHRTLYEARPSARHLTEFYLWMSFGGALGGLFAALVAPRIFSEVFEYPLLLALSFACRPGALRPNLGWSGIAGAAALLTAGFAAIYLAPFLAVSGLDLGGWGVTPFVALAFALALLIAWRAPTLQMVAAYLMFATVTLLPSGISSGEAQRSFFGVYRVAQSSDGKFNVLTHGTTLHGAQRLVVENAEGGEATSATDATVPGTYYYPGSPMARVIAATRARLLNEGRVGTYGIVGLGTGSLACLSRPRETWRFFEIDPLVVQIAAYSGYFTFIGNCLSNFDVKLGDARLTLSREADAAFDLLLIDAFTSDAVPVHLMTVEALQLYARKTTPNGVIVLHISNRYLDLEAVVAATLERLPGLKGLIIEDSSADGSYDQSNSTIAVFAKDPYALDVLRTLPGARDPQGEGLRPWTDEASDILGPLLSQAGW